MQLTFPKKTALAALFLLTFFASTAITAKAINPVAIYLPGYGGYTNNAYPSSTNSCLPGSASWQYSMAYSFAWPPGNPNNLYWYYLDVYNGNVSMSGDFRWGYFVYLYSWNGGYSRHIGDIAYKSFFTPDITVWLNEWVTFPPPSSGNRTVTFEADISRFIGIGPDPSCWFTSYIQWYN